MVSLRLRSLRRHAPLMIVLALAACGGGGGSSSNVVTVSGGGTPAPAPAPSATPAPSPTPTPSPSPTAVPAPTLAGLPSVPSGINVADYLQPSWGTGAVASPEPGPTGVQVEGAFRFLCAPSHNAYDDPIVYPGQPGKAHLHTFFGNTKTDANSTYTSLRTTGESTCSTLLNRSAYWVPAMMNGRGKVVMPDVVSIYYKRRSTTDPLCKVEGKACVPLPRGLRYVFGYNMTTGAPAPAGTVWFNCDGAGAVNGQYANIAQAAKNCPVGARLEAVVVAPTCWNGTELDSADHRSHMAYMYNDGSGVGKCPATHPYIIPMFQLAAYYTTDATLDRSGDESASATTWYFSSDRMASMGNMVPGSTFHADWFGAWEDSIQDMWTSNCIEKMLSCAGGDLGNGQQMKMLKGYDDPHFTNLVDPPAN